MSDSANEAIFVAVAAVMYFGGLMVWPVQACVRRKWDRLSKGLALVCGIHLVFLIFLALYTKNWLGTDAHHAWWWFVLLNLGSLFASLVVWIWKLARAANNP